MIYCFNCNKECTSHYWQVKIIDENGNMRFEKVCSEKCADDVTDKYTKIHENRAYDVSHQCYQKIRIKEHNKLNAECIISPDYPTKGGRDIVDIVNEKYKERYGNE